MHTEKKKDTEEVENEKRFVASGPGSDKRRGSQRDNFARDDLVYVPGIDLPRSRYSRTDGLRNPGGTAGASFVGLFLSSTESS